MNINDREHLVQKIRTQYTERQHSELEQLQKLDRKVKRPANVFAYLFGSLGAIIMGSGMSLVMTDIAGTLGIGDPMMIGIPVGVVGLIIALVNFPIYKRILACRRKKFAPQILALSEKLLEKS